MNWNETMCYVAENYRNMIRAEKPYSPPKNYGISLQVKRKKKRKKIN